MTQNIGLDLIKQKLEKLLNEKKQMETSANFFRQNLEQTQIRLIQLDGQINLLNDFIKPEEIKKEETQEEK